MSEVTYTKCDFCKTVSPRDPLEVHTLTDGWSKLHVWNWSDDLCPNCTEKLFETTGSVRKEQR